MDYHELANAYELTEGEEFDRLVESIDKNGQLVPIMTYQGKIVDGRNRYRACKKLGKEPVFYEWDGKGDLIEIVVGLNSNRRHLNATTRALAALNFLPFYEAMAKENMSKGGKGCKNFTPLSGKALALAAKVTGANQQYVSQLKKLKEVCPTLFEQVRDKTLTIPQAMQKWGELQAIQADEEKQEVYTDPEVVTDEDEEAHLPDGIQLWHGDFNTLVLDIPDCSVQLIVTDPPYNISSTQIFEFDKDKPYTERRAPVVRNFGSWDDNCEYMQWCVQWERILCDGGSGYVFVADRYLSYMRDALSSTGLDVRATIVWHKTNPGTQVVKTNYKSSVEYIVFFTKGGKAQTFAWLGENLMHNFMQGPICMGDERLKDSDGNTLHPTQKPEYVLRKLLTVSSKGGDLVFDGFAGTATTGKVACDMGRKFIGIERDKAFYDAAFKRLAVS